MSNRSDPTHSKPDAAVDAMAGVATEPIAGRGPRRRWSSSAKARIVGESLQPGAVVSEIAKRHGVPREQVYAWRRQALAAGSGSAAPCGQTKRAPKRNGSIGNAVEVVPAFAPVVMATPAQPLRPTGSEASLVEIAIGDVTIRVRGLVDVESLIAVLNAVRRASW